MPPSKKNVTQDHIADDYDYYKCDDYDDYYFDDEVYLKAFVEFIDCFKVDGVG